MRLLLDSRDLSESMIPHFWLFRQPPSLLRAQGEGESREALPETWRAFLFVIRALADRYDSEWDGLNE